MLQRKSKGWTKEKQGNVQGGNWRGIKGRSKGEQGNVQYREKTKEKIIEKERVCTFVIHSHCITFLLYFCYTPLRTLVIHRLMAFSSI